MEFSSFKPFALDSSAPTWDQLPYPGLRPFKHDEAPIFFGRDQQINELLDLLATSHFVAIIGPSGCGKSSLIRAGVLPALQSGVYEGAGASWYTAIMRPKNCPMWSLAELLTRCLKPGLENPTATEIGPVRGMLGKGVDGVRELLGNENGDAPAENLLILVDQFEELFRYDLVGGEQEASDFVSLLLNIVKNAQVPSQPLNTIYLMITMRTDYLGDCARFIGLPEIINTSHYLTPRLNDDELKLAIEQPALISNGLVEPQLTKRILKEMGSDPDQLPLMQHALMWMWIRARLVPPDQPITLTLNDYSNKEVGNLLQALSNHADQIFMGLEDHQKRVAEIVFRCLTERDDGQREIRRPTTAGQIMSLAEVDLLALQDVIEPFAQPSSSFLALDSKTLSENTIIDIGHESLIRQWERLRAWTEREAESGETFREIVRDAKRYKKGEIGLLDELRLRTIETRISDDAKLYGWCPDTLFPAKNWAKRYIETEINFDVAKDYWDTSKDQIERLRETKRREQKQEEKRRIQAATARSKERARAAWGIAIAVLIGAVTTVTLSYQGLKQGREDWLEQQVSFLANNIRDEPNRWFKRIPKFQERWHQGESDLLNLIDTIAKPILTETFTDTLNENVLDIQQLFEGYSALIRNFPLTKIVKIENPEDLLKRSDIYDIATSGDGRLKAAIIGEQGQQILVFFKNRVLGSLKNSESDKCSKWSGSDEEIGNYRRLMTRVALIDNSRWLASTGIDRCLRLWKLPSGKVAGELDSITPELYPLGESVRAVAFSRDGRRLANVRSRIIHEHSETDTKHEQFEIQIRDLSLDKKGMPANERLISKEETLINAFDVANFAFQSLEEKSRVAVSFANGRTYLWDFDHSKINSQNVGDFVTKETGIPKVIDIAPTGNSMAVSSDTIIEIWNISVEGKRKPAPQDYIYGHHRPVTSLKFVTDDLLISGDDRGNLRLWDPNQSRILTFLGDPDKRKPVGALTVDHKNQKVTTFHFDGSLRQLDMKQVELARKINIVPLKQIPSVTAISPTKGTVAVGFDTGGIGLYAPNGEEIETLPMHAPVTTLSFSWNGDKLAAADRHGKVTIWSMEDKKIIPNSIKPSVVNNLAFSPNGDQLAVARDNGVDMISLTSDGKHYLGNGSNRMQKVNTVQFNGKGDRLLAGTKVNTVEFNGKGDKLLAGTDDGKIIIWDVRNGKLHAQKDLSKPASIRGLRTIRSVAFSPAGKRIAGIVHSRQSPTERRTKAEPGVQIFDESLINLREKKNGDAFGYSRSGTGNLPWEGNTGIRDVEITPSGRQIVTSDSRGNIRVFDLRTEQMLFNLKSVEYVGTNAPETKTDLDVDFDFRCVENQNDYGNCLISVILPSFKNLLIYKLGRPFNKSERKKLS